MRRNKHHDATIERQVTLNEKDLRRSRGVRLSELTGVMNMMRATATGIEPGARAPGASVPTYAGFGARELLLVVLTQAR